MIIRVKENTTRNHFPHFSAVAFFRLQKLEAFFSSLVLAHRRCAHSFSASQLGELVLIEDRH